MKKLLSGNEAFALGAYHAGVRVATAYPGTPSTEILEAIATHEDLYAEWSTNEKVAMEVAIGAVYAGARALVCMKHVGLNVASDPFLAVATTGVNAGLVVVSADDPGLHSSQGEQDNRHFARLAKVPMLEPSDSQEAYDLMTIAYDLSEKYDTPVLMRSVTRLSHSNSVVNITGERKGATTQPAFTRNAQKYVMLPAHARLRRPAMEERLVKLAAYAETFTLNRIEWGDRKLGIITSGISYQYAKEVFPKASFLKLTMTYSLPANLIRTFAEGVEKLIVIEELDPFLQENIRALGIKVDGKEFIPRMGELSPEVVEASACKAGLLTCAETLVTPSPKLPRRPPLLCPGCPHTGIYSVLSSMGQRSKPPKSKSKLAVESPLIITGDIGCYTLGAYPPHLVLDTCSCMGASIGEAIGMAKAGVAKKVIAIIGDSTFLHSGITGLVDAVYNKSKITLIILDNGTTAMTGHQEHPGTGVSIQGKPMGAVKLEDLVRGIGVSDVKIVNAFDLKELREGVKRMLESNKLSVLIVRGNCAVRVLKRNETRVVDQNLCNQCTMCLTLGCPTIQSEDGRIVIDAALCTGCTLCEQICPRKAIRAITKNQTPRNDQKPNYKI